MRGQSRILPAIVAVALAPAVTACGSSGAAHRPANGDAVSGGVRYADCMRSNGVPNFPDPGGGAGLVVPNYVNPASPAFRTAQHACQSLMPGLGARAPATAQQKAAMLGLARCMRGHGVSGFPDPVSSPPVNPAGFAMAFGRPGSVIVIPDALNPQSPAFRRAALACGLPGASGGAKRA